MDTDVVVVGGGIAGLTTAYLLKQAGLRVIVLEKNTIGSGTTSKTTGKVTSQHGLVYAGLQKNHGEDTARIYGEANQEALEEIKKLIRQEKIDCGWQVADNYVYTTDLDRVEELRQEAKIAARLGLPASFENFTNLPFETPAAVKFSNQAKFNVQKYVLGLAAAVDGQGSYVFENSKASSYRDGDLPTVTVEGLSISAKDIVITTKIPAAPLLARGSYALLERPNTSYIVAGRYSGPLNDMFISPDEENYSILPWRDDTTSLLLIGGESHIPGLGIAEKRYQILTEYAEKHFGIVIEYRWKGMDYLAYDDIPLVGKLYPWSSHIYTATGFKKWGLTTSMVSARILHDLILKQRNPWARVFDSTRKGPIMSIPRYIMRA